MKKQNFYKKINKLEKLWEDFTYSKCKTVQEKCNWKNNHVLLLDSTRIFFFGKKNTVILIDKSNSYIKHFKNPTLAIKEIDSFLIALIDSYKN